MPSVLNRFTSLRIEMGDFILAFVASMMLFVGFFKFYFYLLSCGYIGLRH